MSTSTLSSIQNSYDTHQDDPIQAYYVGEYINDMRQVAIASLFSGQHASFQSPAGWGKTEILSDISKRVAGEQYTNRIDLMPSSNPAVFIGLDDPQQLINHGKFVKVLDGTPYDPNMRIVMADELFRANEPTFDAALHAFDHMKQDHCIVWATNNFVAHGERVAALLDRIALWQWIEPDTLDTDALVSAMMKGVGKLSTAGWLPTWQDVEEVRKAKPTAKSTEAVKATIRDLVEEGSNEGFNVGHPRMVGQWWKILFYNGVAYTGIEDFDTLPNEAVSCLRFAYGAKNADEAKRWVNTVTQIVDKVQAEIDRVLAECVKEFKRVSSVKDLTDRTAEIPALGLMLADAQTTLTSQFGDKDARITQTLTTINQWMAYAVRGDEGKIGY